MEDSRLEETSLKNARFEKMAVKVIVIEVDKGQGQEDGRFKNIFRIFILFQ